jgi:predicted transcriptional regulator
MTKKPETDNYALNLEVAITILRYMLSVEPNNPTPRELIEHCGTNTNVYRYQIRLLMERGIIERYRVGRNARHYRFTEEYSRERYSETD